MGIGDRILTSWRLGIGGLRIIGKDKTLLGYPAVTVASVFAIFSLVYLVVGRQLELLIVAIFSSNSALETSSTFYTLLLSWYFMLAFVAVFMHVALIGAIHISMNERDSNFMDGLRVAWRFMPSIIFWTLISYTFGFLVTMLDMGRGSSRIVRKVLGAGWSVITFLVVPLMIVENQNIFKSLAQSNKVMEKKWGDNLHPGFSLGWFFLLLNLPLLAYSVYVYMSAPEWRTLESIFGAAYFVLTLVIVQTARAVLMVVFYEYAATGKVAEGFSEDFLRNAFVPWDTGGFVEMPMPKPLPAQEPIPVQAPVQTPEPTSEPTPEPIAAPTIEPTPEPTVEPIPEPTPEPTVEPTPEPTPEPTIEPTDTDASTTTEVPKAE